MGPTETIVHARNVSSMAPYVFFNVYFHSCKTDAGINGAVVPITDVLYKKSNLQNYVSMNSSD